VVFGDVSDRALRGHGDGADVSVGLRLLEWWAEVVYGCWKMDASPCGGTWSAK
jgi:hypothetical protein